MPLRQGPIRCANRTITDKVKKTPDADCTSRGRRVLAGRLDITNPLNIALSVVERPITVKYIGMPEKLKNLRTGCLALMSAQKNNGTTGAAIGIS